MTSPSEATVDGGAREGATLNRRALAGTQTCRSCRARKPADRKHFSPDNHGGFRKTCKSCASKDEIRRQKDRKRRGIKWCKGCRKYCAATQFPFYMRDGVQQRRETCQKCLSIPPSVLEESELLQHKNLKRSFRWAVSLQILLGCRRMTMADLLALKPDARRAFEERWSDLMREMAEDVGELVVIIDPLMQGKERVPDNAALVRVGRARAA